jgi:Fic family protein
MNTRIIKLIAEIDEFKGFWKGMERISAETLHTLRVLATIESIGSSTRIEGARLTDREVAALLEGIDTRSFRSRDEQEVAGYADTMRLVHESYPEINLTENNIRYIHKSLMRYSTKDNWHLGEYKKHPNHVAAFDEDGNEIGIIFETTSPFETPQAMKNLVELTQAKIKDGSEHPLLVISDFTVRFLAIHPFQDGNGRISRILTNLLLLRAGYDYVQYSSHERIVEANKEQYYLSLRKAQKALKKQQESPLIWTEFFLEMLKKQKDLLYEKIKREKLAYLEPKLSQDILILAREHGRVTVSFSAKTLSANRNTIKKHVQHLGRAGKLVLHGKGRGAFYTLP